RAKPQAARRLPLVGVGAHGTVAAVAAARVEAAVAAQGAAAAPLLGRGAADGAAGAAGVGPFAPHVLFLDEVGAAAHRVVPVSGFRGAVADVGPGQAAELAAAAGGAGGVAVVERGGLGAARARLGLEGLVRGPRKVLAAVQFAAPERFGRHVFAF